MDGKFKLLYLYKAIDTAEQDPLDDDEFIEKEYLYGLALAALLSKGIQHASKLITELEMYMGRSELLTKVLAVVTKEFAVDLMRNMDKIVDRHVAGIFKHGRNFTGGIPSPFERKAVTYLQNCDKFYLRKKFSKYSPKLKQQIRDIVLNMDLNERAVRRELEALLQKTVSAQFSNYQVVSGTSANRARNWGHIIGFKSRGVKTVTFVAVLDHRTTVLCESLNGTVYTIEQCYNHIEDIINSGEEEIERVAPFRTVEDIKNPDGSLKSTENLVALGVHVPPLHFRCRSSLIEGE